MSALKKISDKFGHFDDWHHVNKFSLVLIVVIFAAIPLTVFTAVTLRQINPKAETNPYIAYNLSSSPSGYCVPDPTRAGQYKANVNFSWRAAGYAISSDRQVLDVGTSSSFASGTYYPGSTVTGRTSIQLQVNKEQTLYWRINTHYTNGVWAPSAAVRVNNNCTIAPVADTTPPSVPSGLHGTANGFAIAIGWNASTDNVTSSGNIKNEILRTTSAGASTTFPGSYPGITTFIDKDVSVGVTYQYQVRAIDSSGNKSAFSARITIPFTNTDTDADGFPDRAELWMGTNPSLACGGLRGWPPDFNDDRRVNVVEMALISKHSGTNYEPNTLNSNGVYFNSRYDLNADGRINSADADFLARYFGKTCT